MKKICMVVYHYYYRDSRLRRYAEGLAGAGVPVDVLPAAAWAASRWPTPWL